MQRTFRINKHSSEAKLCRYRSHILQLILNLKKTFLKTFQSRNLFLTPFGRYDKVYQYLYTSRSICYCRLTYLQVCNFIYCIFIEEKSQFLLKVRVAKLPPSLTDVSNIFNMINS